MSKSDPKQPEVSIAQLGRIIDRENNTIRAWERTGKLPKRLHPHRGPRNIRYWTHDQVHGKDGIIAWMEKNDMRPGKKFADPSNQGKHLQHLRRPKFISKDLVHLAVLMLDDGSKPEEVIKTLFPRTKYVSEQNFEVALRRYLKNQGIKFPPIKKPKTGK